jgi:hypothetical protein
MSHKSSWKDQLVITHSIGDIVIHCQIVTCASSVRFSSTYLAGKSVLFWSTCLKLKHAFFLGWRHTSVRMPVVALMYVHSLSFSTAVADDWHGHQASAEPKHPRCACKTILIASQRLTLRDVLALVSVKHPNKRMEMITWAPMPIQWKWSPNFIMNNEHLSCSTNAWCGRCTISQVRISDLD